MSMRLEMFAAPHLANQTVDLCMVCGSTLGPRESFGWDHDLIGHVCGACVSHVAASEMRLALIPRVRPPTDEEAMEMFTRGR